VCRGHDHAAADQADPGADRRSDGGRDTGSTYENRTNLAPAFLEQVVRKYEGTRLGRQELYEQGRVHHLGAFPQLEDQMCGFVPADRHASVATTVSGSYTGSATRRPRHPALRLRRDCDITRGLIGSQETAGFAATATTTYSISKTGTTAGTMVSPAGRRQQPLRWARRQPTWRATSYRRCAGVVNATLANLAWTFVGSH
jgi:hypothetical protein